MNEIKVELGKKREFSTGAKKQAAVGKGTPVLIPGDAMLDVAKHFEAGAIIYDARNWEKGIPLSELLNSVERHLQQEKMGMADEPHARALAWNAIVYLATKLRVEAGQLPPELADMPDYEPNKPHPDQRHELGTVRNGKTYVKAVGDIKIHDHSQPEPQFKKGDEVKIKLRNDVPNEVRQRYNGGTGIYLEPIADEEHFVIFNGDTCFFYTDELTLVKEN